MKLSTYKTPLRYFFAVVCGYCIDFAIYVACIKLEVFSYWARIAGFSEWQGLSIYAANAVGFIVGATINVILIRKYVFVNNRFRFSVDLPLTLAVNTAMLGVGMGLLWLFVELFSINPYGGKLLANGVTFVLNYTIRAAFFRKK